MNLLASMANSDFTISDDITPGRDQLTGLVDGGLFTLFELCVRMCDHMSKDDHNDGRRGTIQMLIYSKNKAIFLGISLSASQRSYQSKVTPPSNNNETDDGQRWARVVVDQRGEKLDGKHVGLTTLHNYNKTPRCR